VGGPKGQNFGLLSLTRNIIELAGCFFFILDGLYGHEFIPMHG
jgi:hypothetical protein